jgi:hypothetical protein
VSGAPLPAGLPYGEQITAAAKALDFPPALAYAIKICETGRDDPPDICSGDGGHGLFQLTSYVPAGWDDPQTCAHYAILDWLLPDALRIFRELELAGDDLVRAVAAAFNAGWGGMLRGHLAGDVDRYTTNRYGERALSHYRALAAGRNPF